jgi:hypothetical protein
MRIKQKEGTRGSLMFIQRLLTNRPELFDTELQRAGAIKRDERVKWVSPRADDDWAEYRDAAFLERLGRGDLASDLREFWPARGPQWDALGTAGDTLILVEAKAHIGELTSNCAAGADESRKKIIASLDTTKVALGVREDADWLNGYYQLANRFAHLHFLRSRGADARLVLLQFTGKTGMPTASTVEAYGKALRVAYERLGFASKKHPDGVVHINVDVADLG